MFGHSPFYHATTRRYISVFGTLFNDIRIFRRDNAGDEQKRFLVPIAYGPMEKFLARIQGDEDLDRPTAMVLPRISFEITNVTYDAERALSVVGRNNRTSASNDAVVESQFVPTPYNIEFTLSIMAKYGEDAMKILEQILPFFRPEWTTSVELVDGSEEFWDIPTILTSVVNEEVYEGQFTERRVVLWTLTFTMKGWYFGPTTTKKIIKFANVSFYTGLANGEWSDTYSERVKVYPGLTIDGSPSTDPANTVHWSLINQDDDWDYIVVIESIQ